MVCSGCTKELSMPEITKVVEPSKGMFVPVTDAELDAVAIPSNGALIVQELAPASVIRRDPTYFDGHSYYLIPDPADKFPATAYKGLLQSLIDDDLVLIARTAMYRREYTCLIRPGNGVLMLDQLRYPQDIRQVPTVALPNIDPRQLALIKQINQANLVQTPKLDYPDNYGTGFQTLVQSKLAGQPIPTLPTQPVQTAGVDLEAMLLATLAQAQANKTSKEQPAIEEPKPAAKPAAKGKGKGKKAVA
jgi:DNA end-binding protein Ku